MVKRKLPPHIVLPDGRWRFVKRGSKNVSKRKSHRMGKTMAKGRYRKHYSKARGFLGGGMMHKLIPVAGGLADSVAPPLMGVTGYASFLIGWIAKDNITCGIGGYQIGQSLGSKFGGGTGGLL
jgi:hypothetical protein